MIDYRGKGITQTLAEENKKLQTRWEKLKTFAVVSNLKGLIKKMEELEQE